MKNLEMKTLSAKIKISSKKVFKKNRGEYVRVKKKVK